MSRAWTSGNQISVLGSLAGTGNGSPVSVSFWMKTAAVIPPTTCSSTGLLAIGGTILMGFQSGTGVTVFQYATAFGGPGTLNMRGTGNITDANWHNLVFVGVDSGTCFIYNNGVQESSLNSGAFPAFTRTDTLWPNQAGGQFTNNYIGTLAELAVWHNTALNASEAAQLYNGALPCFIRPNTLERYIPSYGVAGLGGGEANYGLDHNVPTVGTSVYADHPPVTQLDLGFTGTIGFTDQPEQWLGTFALSNYTNAPPSGFGDWSPPSV